MKYEPSSPLENFIFKIFFVQSRICFVFCVFIFIFPGDYMHSENLLFVNFRTEGFRRMFFSS